MTVMSASKRIAFSSFWIQKHIEPYHSPAVILSATANITNPSGEIGHSDKFIIQPREICDLARMKHTGLAVPTEALQVLRLVGYSLSRRLGFHLKLIAN